MNYAGVQGKPLNVMKKTLGRVKKSFANALKQLSLRSLTRRIFHVYANFEINNPNELTTCNKPRKHCSASVGQNIYDTKCAKFKQLT